VDKAGRYTDDMDTYRTRRAIALIFFILLAGVPLAGVSADLPTLQEVMTSAGSTDNIAIPAELSTLRVKGRAPKTGYERSQFGNGWLETDGCDTRNIILARDMTMIRSDDGCKILSGRLHDPYTGKDISFTRGESTSDDVQIDHVVALSNAWQTGAQQLTAEKRTQLANDALNLLAVDGPTNEQKSDGDAATWLPPNKSFRCQYVKRQISVKIKYELWVTSAERTAMARVLNACHSG